MDRNYARSGRALGVILDIRGQTDGIKPTFAPAETEEYRSTLGLIAAKQQFFLLSLQVRLPLPLGCGDSVGGRLPNVPRSGRGHHGLTIISTDHRPKPRRSSSAMQPSRLESIEQTD
jgi:hypothetical protein